MAKVIASNFVESLMPKAKTRTMTSQEYLLQGWLMAKVIASPVRVYLTGK